MPSAKAASTSIPDSADLSSHANLTVALGSTTIALAAFFLLARLYSNRYLTRSIGYDDLTCVLAMFLSAGFLGFIVRTKQDARHSSDDPNAALAVSFLETLYVGTILSGTSLYTAKISLFLLLHRLFAPNPRVRRLIYLGIAASIALLLAIIIVSTVLCVPGPAQHWNSPPVVARCTKGEGYHAIVQGSISAILDFYIMFIPIPIMWQLQLPLRKKMGVTAIFTTGIIACATSLLGLTYRIKLLTSSNTAGNASIVGLLSLVETNIAIVCSCMPAFAAFLKHITSHTRSCLRVRTRPTTDGFTNLGSSYPLGKTPRPAVVPSCYTVSQAQGRDKTFLAKNQLKNQAQKGDADTIRSLLPKVAPNSGGIVQSLEVDVSVSTNYMRGCDGNVVPYE